MKIFSSQAVKSERIKRGLTQEQLARRANVTVSAITSIEAGRRSPGAGTLAAIADALRVKTDAFFTDDAA